MIARTTMIPHRKAPHRPQVPYPPRRDLCDRRDQYDRRGQHMQCDRHGGLTGEFAALGSLFTAGYLFLVIL